MVTRQVKRKPRINKPRQTLFYKTTAVNQCIKSNYQTRRNLTNNSSKSRFRTHHNQNKSAKLDYKTHQLESTQPLNLAKTRPRLSDSRPGLETEHINQLDNQTMNKAELGKQKQKLGDSTQKNTEQLLDLMQ